MITPDEPTEVGAAFSQKRPPVGVDVLVDCGSFRCVAHLTASEKWISTYNGEELRNVVSWAEFGAAS
jgi:hypothetical protein